MGQDRGPVASTGNGPARERRTKASPVSKSRLSVGAWAAFAAAIVAALAVSQPAFGMPSTTADVTWATNGRVSAIAQVGNLVVMGGTFTEVHEAGGAGPGVLPRSNLAAFDATTGAPVSGWAPSFN